MKKNNNCINSEPIEPCLKRSWNNLNALYQLFVMKKVLTEFIEINEYSVIIILVICNSSTICIGIVHKSDFALFYFFHDFLHVSIFAPYMKEKMIQSADIPRVFE